MIVHKEILLPRYSRGFHLVTSEILSQIDLPDSGLLHLFIKHTSAGICINENTDPDVLHDFELIMNRIVPENQTGLYHTVEGPDDMPAHVKSTLVGHYVSIPIVNRQLALGTWQGIYLCEFRNNATPRKIIATSIS
jgi:secondary thiamine-phosphate synthase enzyme